MAQFDDPLIEHLLRRAGFGARVDELSLYSGMSYAAAVDALVNYPQAPDDVDQNIGRTGFAGTTSRGMFSPNSNLTDARQRWLFRMVHTNRPLQEKMTLFWHNHFATAQSKIAGEVGGADAVRYMAAKAAEDPAGLRGQIEMLRDNALGNFRDILAAIAQDVAMLIWLDGRSNTKASPQENFAREIMELFTMGVGHYTEADVYAGARVFTGWNLRRTGSSSDGTQRLEFAYLAAQHDTEAKTFSFPVVGGSHTIPARPAAAGMQDGLDLIAALAASPETARYLAAKLYRFFVSDFGAPDSGFVNSLADVYLRTGGDMRSVVREVLLSAQFRASAFQRYSWPVEFVVRAIKDVGWTGFSVNDAVIPLANMGQSLYEPPDVAGWDTGQTWFSTGAMLSRMNFAAGLAANQKFNLARIAKGSASSPDALLAFFEDQLASAAMDGRARNELLSYLTSTGAWTGSDAQLQAKAPGLVHLMVGSAEYQFA